MSDATATANGQAAGGQPTHSTLAEAVVAVQSELPAIEPDQTNPHFKSKFVSLGALISKVRPILNEHGIAVSQKPCLDGEGRFVLRTTFTHTSGETDQFDSPLSPEKNTPQAQGSAITYMRRYSLAAALAIVDQEDDDGTAASARQEPTRAQAKRREGQGDGRSSQATANQRRKIHARASELGLTEPQLKAWIEWNAGTPHTDRIEKTAASKLIEMLDGYEDGAEALSAFNAALEAEDEKAQKIAAKYTEQGGEEG